MMLATNITTDVMQEILELNQDAVNMLSKIESYNFNIFQLKESTKNNPLVTVVSHIMAKEKIFDDLLSYIDGQTERGFAYVIIYA